MTSDDLFLDDSDTDCMLAESWDKIPKNLQHLVLRIYSELSHYRGLARGLDRGGERLLKLIKDQETKK